MRRLPPAPRRRRRSRFGYDHRWWGEAAGAGDDRRTYWGATRRPFPCLLFVAPILLAYEFGVLWLGGASAASLRTGADAWMRQVLATAGPAGHRVPPPFLVV